MKEEPVHILNLGFDARTSNLLRCLKVFPGGLELSLWNDHLILEYLRNHTDAKILRSAGSVGKKTLKILRDWEEAYSKDKGYRPAHINMHIEYKKEDGEQNCCGNCRYYRKVDESDYEGLCQRYPPKLFFIKEQFDSHYPQTDYYGYCGEWIIKLTSQEN